MIKDWEGISLVRQQEVEDEEETILLFSSSLARQMISARKRRSSSSNNNTTNSSTLRKSQRTSGKITVTWPQTMKKDTRWKISYITAWALCLEVLVDSTMEHLAKGWQKCQATRHSVRHHSTHRILRHHLSTQASSKEGQDQSIAGLTEVKTDRGNRWRDRRRKSIRLCLLHKDHSKILNHYQAWNLQINQSQVWGAHRSGRMWVTTTTVSKIWGRRSKLSWWNSVLKTLNKHRSHQCQLLLSSMKKCRKEAWNLMIHQASLLLRKKR